MHVWREVSEGQDHRWRLLKAPLVTPSVVATKATRSLLETQKMQIRKQGWGDDPYT